MENLEKIFQALGNKTRLKIVSLILQANEVSCQDLRTKFNLAQPTMSHHFKELMGSGILKMRKIGVENYYSVDKKLLAEIGLNGKKLLQVTSKEVYTAQRGV
jgi:ArsR family transcriptional regulator